VATEPLLPPLDTRCDAAQTAGPYVQSSWPIEAGFVHVLHRLHLIAYPDYAGAHSKPIVSSQGWRLRLSHAGLRAGGFDPNRQP
jgi:hypothetical protein